MQGCARWPVRQRDVCAMPDVQRNGQTLSGQRKNNMKKPKIHYAGAVRTPTVKILPGWAACCSGDKADRIRSAGANTYDPEMVTCAACRRVMAKDKSIFDLKHEDPCGFGHE